MKIVQSRQLLQWKNGSFFNDLLSTYNILNTSVLLATQQDTAWR